MIDYQNAINEIQKLYINDRRPWIIGFSGGKDSTCVTQLVYYMIKKLPPDKRKKEVYVLSSDTLVESPYIQERIKKSCNKIETQATKDNLPISVKILRPELNDTFWINLIGRGYPSPNQWFRWCTERLKIKPVTKYTVEHVKANGEVIIILGARKDESGSRAQTMSKYEIKNYKLRRHKNISGAYIYTPLENWSLEDVWAYLFQVKSPWGDNNRDLFALYKKCDSECPLVIDESTPACGGSRFGCWVCTVVERDRALEGLIEEGETWLTPLLEFRNWLKDIRNDPKARNPIRKSDRKKKRVADFFGKDFIPSEHRGHKVLGPFSFKTRHEILQKLLALQSEFIKRKIVLISPEEIKAIETLWIYEGDNISSISEVLDSGRASMSSKNNFINKDLLVELCSKYKIPVDLIERLLIVEKDFSKLSRRTGIFSRLERVIEEYVRGSLEKQ